MSTQKDFVKAALCLPPELHQAIHDARKGSERTFNAEILFGLRSTFQSLAQVSREVRQ
ncbi:hypothetical protein ACOTD8_06690 [Achromobacter dolens]|uniref:hypothetical protein n=1 Tax=Achromobacter dolens TaxID=1287738 RepID=UPI003B997933